MNRRRVWIGVAAGVAVLVAALLWGLRLAAQHLQSALTQALGPRASVGSVSLGWSGVELTELRIRAAPGWPAADELRAARVRVTPSLLSLFGGPWRIRSVTVDDAYLSLLRTRDGKLRVLPALLERPRTEAGAGKEVKDAIALRIGRVWLDDVAIEFYDASVRQPAHRMRIEQLDAEVGPIALPGLNETMDISMAGTFKGPQRDGTLQIKGSVAMATRDADVHARLKGVDLIALQPYLLKSSEAGVQRGSLDLTLDAKVERNRLRAPGTLTLTDLTLSTDSGMLGTFAGVPRQTVLAAISKKGRIEVSFTLEGKLDDPKFSLNESFALRMGAGLAETLGVSLGGVVEGMGNVLKGLLGR